MDKNRFADAYSDFTITASDNTGYSLVFYGGTIGLVDTFGSVLAEFDAEDIPAADVELVRHGHWQTTDAYPHWVCCSECHVKFIPNIEWIGRYDIPTKYCPNCGACMDGENLPFGSEEPK